MRTSFLLAILVVSSSISNAVEPLDVWIGTSGHRMSKGIYHCTLNPEDGKLTIPTLAIEVRGPGFLDRHPTLPCLYAVGTLDNKPSVIAYGIEKGDSDPTLKLLNSVEIGDGGATHLAVDATGKTIVTAQYGRGSIAVFSLNEDGSVKERTQLIKHTDASGVRPNQTSPHPHWAGFSPDNKFVFIPDLGKDQIVIYSFDAATSKLTPHGAGIAPAGAGPRHMKFHSNGKWIYVLNENDVTVTLFDYDAQAGTMSAKQTEAAVPKEQLARELRFSASEIRMHPNGRFAYSASRGHDTITAFRIDQESGELTVVERENVRGARPRNFNLDPTGKWLLAAGQNSHTLASFAVNQDTGELTYNRNIVHAPAPICVVIE
jgi:6-phosphogluconolactonase